MMRWLVLGPLAIAPLAALAYPGGTGDYQTDVAPYCASCHSSRNVEVLAGSGQRAEKELARQRELAGRSVASEARIWSRNLAAATIGPMVWDEDGPMPTLNISKTERNIQVALPMGGVA